VSGASLTTAMLRSNGSVASIEAGRGVRHLPSISSQPYQRRPSRLSICSPWSRENLDLDAGFFWLLLVFLVLLVCFLNLRSKHVELSPHQVAEYERRTQVLSNSTVYIAEVHRPEGLLSTLSRDDWQRVSQNIDFVAFVYDDLPVFLKDDWVARIEQALVNPTLPHVGRFRAGLGIMLFPCGCILQNAYFRAVEPRLRGMECNLLPGWVLPQNDVHWIDGLDPEDSGMPPCKRQKRISASQVVSDFASDLASIQHTLEKIRIVFEVPQSEAEAASAHQSMQASNISVVAR
jgi:hypothetical protein